MNEEERRVDVNINFQPYFNQVVASNMVTAFYVAKQLSPDKPDKEILKDIFLLWPKLLDFLEQIPTKKFSSE